MSNIEDDGPMASGSADYEDSDENSEPSPKKQKTEEPDDAVAQTKCKSVAYSTVVNLIKCYDDLQRGDSVVKYRYTIKRSLIEQIKTFKVAKVEAPFDRRVTFIEWHPNNPRLLTVASKGGDIYLWNYNDPIDKARSIKGVGVGGSVHAMKFDVSTPTKVYTVTVEGKFLLLNFQTCKAEEFVDKMAFKRYVSLDINQFNKTMMAGDNGGTLTLVSVDGTILEKIRAHKATSRITHVEFSRRDPWLVCTTSNDRTVKFWDLRYIHHDQDKMADPVHFIQHERALNAAYFSLTDGCRLLTTDQFDKIHVYRSPLWDLETVIGHPHRQFQHLTPIRAYWHPYEDIILAGRYPHTEFPGYTPGELRTIDFFDADTGELLHQHSEHGFNGIAALNRFNSTGDVLASGSGTRVLIWQPKMDLNASIEIRRKPKPKHKSGRKFWPAVVGFLFVSRHRLKQGVIPRSQSTD